MGIANRGALGGGVTVGGGYAVHKLTNFTIREKLEDEGFTISGGITKDGAWNKMQSRVTTKSKTETNEELRGLTDESKTKAWCNAKNTENFGSSISSHNDELLKNVKFYCFLTIKEEMDSNKVLDVVGSTDDTRFSTLMGILRGFSDSSPKLDTKETKRVSGKSTSEIKDSNPSGSSELKAWCKEVYGSLLREIQMMQSTS